MIKDIDYEEELIKSTKQNTAQEILKMIEKWIERKRGLLKEDGLIMNEWWSADIFTGLDIDDLKSKIQEEFLE